MKEHLNWIGVVAMTVGFGCVGLIAFKRSAWWEPARAVFDQLDSLEM